MMDTVRKSAKTTVALIVFCLGLFFLTRWCRTLPNEAIQIILQRLYSKQMFGIYGQLLRIAFWALFISGVEYAAFAGLTSFSILKAFTIPLTATVLLIVGSLIPGIAVQWFWMFHYVLMILCVKSSFSKIGSLNNSGNNKIIQFIKRIGKKQDISGNKIDFYVMYISKGILCILWLVLIFALMVFCVQNRHYFI